MADYLRRLLLHLSSDGIGLLFDRARLPAPELEPGAKSSATTRLVKLIAQGPDTARDLVEALAHEVGALVDKEDAADMALRSVCAGEPGLMAMLDQSASSLTERCLRIALADGAVFAWARNMATGLRQRDGRYHRAFLVRDPGALQADPSLAASLIAAELQKMSGGRCAKYDVFDYEDHAFRGEGRIQTKQHIAIYVGGPAISVSEFDAKTNELLSVIRRPAKEIAIDYCESAGRLDVAGYGVGGGQVLAMIADIFRANALSNAEMSQIERRETHIDNFVRERVVLSDPPDGVTNITIKQIELRSNRKSKGRAIFTGGPGQDAYERMDELDVDRGALSEEFARSVQLDFDFAPCAPDGETRTVSVIVSWPNGLSFSNAGVREKRIIEKYLIGQKLLDPEVDGDG